MIRARIRRDSARKVLYITVMLVEMILRTGHDEKDGRVAWMQYSKWKW